MTRNVYRDGQAQPGELWAAPARSQQGVFGILIGVGHAKVDFIRELDVDEFLLRLVDSGSEEPLGAQGINMIRAAQRDLPGFRASYKAATAVNN